MNFTTDKFSGPLDLLLALIQKNKVSIYDIPISTITSQFLDVIASSKQLGLDISSEFLVMATRLMYIKSRMLLPKLSDDNDEEETEADLIRELEEYSQIKSALAAISDRQHIGDNIFTRTQSNIQPNIIDKTFEGINANLLAESLWAISKRQKQNEAPPKQVFTKVMGKQKVSVSSRVEHILGVLRLNKSFKFYEYFNKLKSTSEAVASFLAVLELLKLNEITLDDNGKIELVG
ncbi:MAG: segregation/condensation protein A [Clostridiales bacterium]|jgi:segregation and condensation protein A|nr:segregation/condensation protein A [Clostridiales bacterium]